MIDKVHCHISLRSSVVKFHLNLSFLILFVLFDEFMDSDNPEKYILPADMAVDFPKISLSAEKATRILNGLFDDYGYPDGFYRVYCEDDFWGIGVSENGILKIKSYVR